MYMCKIVQLIISNSIVTAILATADAVATEHEQQNVIQVTSAMYCTRSQSQLKVEDIYENECAAGANTGSQFYEVFTNTGERSSYATDQTWHDFQKPFTVELGNKV